MRVRDAVRSKPALALAVLVVALALRIGYVVDSSDDPSLRTPFPGLDAQITWEAARVMGADAEPRIEAMMLSAPLHVYWVALHQRVFGESLLRQRVVAAFWGSLRILVTFFVIAAITRARWPAAAVGLLLAGMPSLIYFDTVLLKASTDLLLLTLLVALLVLVRPARARIGAVATGAACGVLLSLAFLSQMATFLYLVPVAAALALVPDWRRSQRALAVGAASILFCSVFIAWQARSDGASDPGAFLPRDGFDLRIGFSPGSDGTYARIPGVSNRLSGHTFESRMLAELEVGRRLSWREANAVHRRMALDLAGRDPLATLRLIGRKLWLAVNDVEIKSEDFLPALRARSRVLAASPVSFALLVVLAVGGVIALARERRIQILALLAGLAGCIVAACCLTFVTWRTRLPLVVPFAMLAGPGLVLVAGIGRSIADWARRRSAISWPRIRELVVLSVAAALSFVPPPVSQERSRAVAAINQRGSARAESEQRELAALDGAGRSVSVSQQDAIRRLELLMSLERHTEAFAATRALIADGVRDRRVIDAHLRYLIWLARYDDAARLLAALDASDGYDPAAIPGKLLQQTIARFVTR